MIPATLVDAYVNREPKFDHINASLSAIPMLPKGMLAEARSVVAYARKFNDEVIKPTRLQLDRKLHEDPDFLAWDFVEKANEWGLYSMFLPKLLGGRGANSFVQAYFNEELASACLSMANLVGVHYLGFLTLYSTFNMRLLKQISQDVVDGEKSGQPCMISLAITEPGAGTDVEEVDLLVKSNVACSAEKVKGGYIVNGSKVFISSGHLCKWHILICYADLKKPADSMIALAVKTGTEGFTFGRVERKMGQKACPASELIFEDCFIPDENVCLLASDYKSDKWRSAEIAQKVIDHVTSGSRVGVGAYGSGVARGAFEQAMKFASETMVAGKLLMNHEWAQSMLAEMYKNWITARLSWTEANYINALRGPLNDLAKKSGFWMNKHMSPFIADKLISPLLDKPATTQKVRQQHFEDQTLAAQQLTSGWGSLTKFSATDLGVRNCRLALQMMGQAGLRHDQGAEKLLRDAKLLQIYEGTNQLNRINLFKNLVGRAYQQAVFFEE